MEMTRKMSVAGINGVRKGFKGLTSLQFIARMFGVVEFVTREATQTGAEQWKFVGEFQGVNAEGKEFGAPVLYLPAPADDALAQAVKTADDESVKFAFDVYAEPDATSLLGYVVKVKPLLAPVVVSAMQDIAASLPAVALTKPADAAPPVPAPAPAPAEDPPATTPAPTPESKPTGKGKK